MQKQIQPPSQLLWNFKVKRSPYLPTPSERNRHKDRLATLSELEVKPRRGHSIRQSIDETSRQGPGYKRRLASNHNRLSTENYSRRQSRHERASKDPLIEKQPNPYGLTESELASFGDRCLRGYRKLSLLGRGGFALVWQCERVLNGKKFALKQILNNSKHNTHQKERAFCAQFWKIGGGVKEEYQSSPGVRRLAKMYTACTTQLDTWMVYEVCGKSLGSELFDIVGDNAKGTRYRMNHCGFYSLLRRDQRPLKEVVRGLAQAIELLSSRGIVHSDLKPDNVLLGIEGEEVVSVKLIDYGSSFDYSDLRGFSMATPEYMSPEILNYILKENGAEHSREMLGLLQEDAPWSVDVWSLGCLLLEVVAGIPLWMSYPVKLRGLVSYGLFAVKGRKFEKIIEKQMRVVESLDSLLQTANLSGLSVEPWLRDLLFGCFRLQPRERITPRQILRLLQTK